jgi:hypothetical protein
LKGRERRLSALPPRAKKPRSEPKPILQLDTSHLQPEDVLNVPEGNDLVKDSKAISLQGVRFDDMIHPPTKGQTITVREEQLLSEPHSFTPRKVGSASQTQRKTMTTMRHLGYSLLHMILTLLLIKRKCSET